MVSNQTNKGFALLLSIIVASVLLALGLTMLSVTSKQLTLSGVVRESEIAVQAALGGMECMVYHWIDDSRSDMNYIAEVTTPGTAPAASCFGVSAATRLQSSFESANAPDDYTNMFEYRFSWGSGTGARCSEMFMFIMRADTANNGDDYVDVNFSAYNDAIGTNGLKTCNSGSICTIVISRGYNKSCADVDAGLATVQREITSQF